MKILNKTLSVLVAVSISIGGLSPKVSAEDSFSLNDDLWQLQTQSASQMILAQESDEPNNPLKEEDPLVQEKSIVTQEQLEKSPNEDDFIKASQAQEGVQKSNTEDTFSIDFAEEEIRNIIRHIADLFNLNVVIPENLSGVISLKLKDVTWPEVFRAILDPIGFSYIQDGKILKIKSLQDINSEPVETKIFPLKFSDANAIMGSILPLVDKDLGGRVLADSRTNVIIITERPTRLKQLEKVVERLDEAESQVMIETKIAEIKKTDGSNKGIDWSVLKAYSASVGNPANIPVTGYPAGINRTWVPKDSSFSRNETIIFNASQFGLILRALETDNKVKIVASPNVVTMNNTKAEINIARRVPVPNYSYNQQTGTFEVSGFNYENIGVLLNVTPKAQQDLITLDIKPELSDSSESVQFGSDNSASRAQIPIINTRKSQSIVTIESGYTLALGGMMKESDTKTVSRVPLIGSIPGPVGKLFSSNIDAKEKTNLIIFVTATRIGFNGVPYVQFKGNIPDNLDPRTLQDIQYTERDMPQYQLSDSEMQALEKARLLRKKQEEAAYDMLIQSEISKNEPGEKDLPEYQDVQYKKLEFEDSSKEFTPAIKQQRRL